MVNVNSEENFCGFCGARYQTIYLENGETKLDCPNQKNVYFQGELVRIVTQEEFEQIRETKRQAEQMESEGCTA